MTAACSRAAKSTPKEMPEVTSAPLPQAIARACDAAELVEWNFSGVTTRAAILKPEGLQNARVPVLVALHGRGEALKGPERGALGWPNDYNLTKALTRVCAPPLIANDFEGLVEDAHLQEMNAWLAQHPWKGLVVVCPWVPDLNLRSDTELLDYGRFVVETILPRVVREMPATNATGIDGVSLGGAVALRAGLAFPQAFKAVAALQPAIDDSRVSDLVDLARVARQKRPDLALRITTSHEDYYRDVTHSLSNAWNSAGVQHDFSELPGPHDYIFNRGPGAYEMLLWHARVLGS
jgi:pimeloyl-ACP methyl ester carboxylesterase